MKIFEEFNISISNLTENIYSIKFVSEVIANDSVPGQFVNVYLPFGEHLLPRPISICFVDEKTNEVTLVYQEVGSGTAKIKTLNKLKIAGPLGNGFSITLKPAHHIIVGGGIGIPPLLYLSSKLNGIVDVYLGAKFEPVLLEHFTNLGALLHVASDYDSKFFNGTVVDLMKDKNVRGDYIYACGPSPMLKSVAEYAAAKNISAQLSLEERMACGFGACVGCAVKINSGSKDNAFQYLKVCSDGPVFNSSEVVF